MRNRPSSPPCASGSSNSNYCLVTGGLCHANRGDGRRGSPTGSATAGNDCAKCVSPGPGVRFPGGFQHPAPRLAGAGQSPPAPRAGCRPTDRVGADTVAMLALPPVPLVLRWRTSTRLPRDHYVRLDGNDYTVHPVAVGRRIEVTADLDRVRVWCQGNLVAGRGRRTRRAPRSPGNDRSGPGSGAQQPPAAAGDPYCLDMIRRRGGSRHDGEASEARVTDRRRRGDDPRFRNSELFQRRRRILRHLFRHEDNSQRDYTFQPGHDARTSGGREGHRRRPAAERQRPGGVLDDRR